MNIIYLVYWDDELHGIYNDLQIAIQEAEGDYIEVWTLKDGEKEWSCEGPYNYILKEL